MKKIKVFRGKKLDDVLDDIETFVNRSDIEVVSTSHAYTNGKQGFLNIYELMDVEYVIIYKLKNTD